MSADRFGIGGNRGPELDPFETLKTRAEELLAEAKGSWGGIIELAGPEQAGRADTFLNQIGSFNLKKTRPRGILHHLYDEKERELQPHRDALAEIKNRYDPVQLTALTAKSIVETLLKRWQKKQEAVLKAAGAPPAVARAGAGVKGEFSTRTRPLPAPDWDVEITDAFLAFVHYQDVILQHSDFLALLRRLARHEARDTKGTKPIPGVRIVPNESAA